MHLLGRGETAGVFQVEGSGMRRNLMEMKPQNLDHVIAMVALFRPGPMDFIPDYIARMHGEEEIDLPASQVGADPQRNLWHHRLSRADHVHGHESGRLHGFGSGFSA